MFPSSSLSLGGPTAPSLSPISHYIGYFRFFDAMQMAWSFDLVILAASIAYFFLFLSKNLLGRLVGLFVKRKNKKGKEIKRVCHSEFTTTVLVSILYEGMSIIKEIIRRWNSC